MTQFDVLHSRSQIISLCSFRRPFCGFYFSGQSQGKISFANLKRVAQELGENLTDDEIQEMIDEADRDGDGEINQDEFMRIMRKTNLYKD
eukprot:m.55610 g.55610  ORF g.55610 m.55610 type:complete len:90 (+) comp48887_c0_seq4:541-810(+)